MTDKSQLRITEIFYSLQGETSTVGQPTVFVRLTGCPLRCQYCDSAYAFSGGNLLTLDDILQQIASYQPRFVTVSGGEPLAQPNCIHLLKQLCDAGYRVSLETSGAISTQAVDERVVKIVDFKTPGSKECARNDINNIKYLNTHDEVKFVICDADDYAWAKAFVAEHQLDSKCQVLFSPSYHQQNATELADWIIRDNAPVRFQVQLHKYVWGDIPGK